MKYKILLIILLLFFSCNTREIKTELKEIYLESAEIQEDTLEIESFEILNITKVDFNFVKKIKINNLNYSIDLNKRIINNDRKSIVLLERNVDRRMKLIQLNPKDKKKYLTEIELDLQRVERSKTNIEKYETEITLTHQQIVLINAELGQNKKSEFDFIEYVFKGKINSEVRVDTMSLLISKEYLPKFIKNNIFTDYRGI